MRLSRLLPCLVLLALILVDLRLPQAVAQTSSAPAPSEEVVDTDQTVSVDAGIADTQIARRLMEILETTGWYDDVTLRVEDGIVFLDGTVTTEPRRDWLRDLAAKTDGVVAIVNRLQLDQEVQLTLDPIEAEMRALWDQAVAAAPSILAAVLILPLALLLSRLVGRLARWMLRGRVRSPFLGDVLARLIALPVFLIGVYVVLQVAGLTQLALSLIGGAGIVGIVIGFAFRDIAENFLASLLLSIRQPFHRNDVVRVGEHLGVVHSMNTRSTVLVSPEGNHIQIPNAQVFKTTIENYTTSASRRETFTVGVGYDVPISEVQDIILEVLRGHEAVVQDPEPMVLADSLGAATVNVMVYFWFDGARVSPIKLRSALIRRVKQALTEAGVSMPDEAREVIFPQGIPIHQADGPPTAAPAPPRPAPAARETDVSEAEGDLQTDLVDLDAQMAAEVEGSGEENLLRG